MHLGSPEKYQMYVKSNLGQQVPALTLALALTLTLSRALILTSNLILTSHPNPDPHQVPASVGSAFHLHKRGEDQCSITYFGEGCASEGDIPSAFNIAAVLGAPVLL